MNMKELRQKTGLSAQGLANKLWIGVSTVNKWEQGGATPNFQHIRPLLEIFEVTFDELEQAVEASLELKGR